MFELERIYNQLDSQFVQLEYTEKMYDLTDGYYDVQESVDNIIKSLQLLNEASKSEGFGTMNKIKSTFASLQKIVKRYKEPALACRPIGLVYKNFKTFIPTSEVEKMYKDAKKTIDKFNVDKASEAELKEYIENAKYGKPLYIDIIEIYGKGKVRYNINEVIVVSEKDKEITKEDIKNAVAVVEKEIADEFVKDYNYKLNKASDDYYSAKEKLKKGKPKGEDKLRVRAKIAQLYLHYISTNMYLSTLASIHNGRMFQSKRIIIKAANYNPRNLKESALIQDYIDSAYDFYENC